MAPRVLMSILLAGATMPAQAAVEITGRIDTAQLAATGRALLHLKFVCSGPLDRPFAVRVDVRRGRELLLRRDHSPPVPTAEWRKGRAVEYELPLLFPPDGGWSGADLAVGAGLLDPATDEVAPLQRDDRNGLTEVCSFVMPAFDGALDAAGVDAVLAAAAATKDPRESWDLLEFAFRRLDDYPLKARLQQALLTAGRAAPPELTFEEQDITGQRVRSERARYLRQVAGRMYDRGKLLGALLLLDEVGGDLQADADRAVLGALADQKRLQQNRDEIAAKVFALTEEQEAEVRALAERHRDRDRLETGVAMCRDPQRRAVGRELVRTLEFATDLKDEAERARAEIEAAWLADVPAVEREEAEAAMQHECWARTTTRNSHRFVIIGPDRLVRGIPDDSLLRFDLAYLYLTDLFGRVPNPDGDRVTVYFKELWDFGGGVGGGKTIDIGKADPDRKALRVDTGLLYHELTHCIDDTQPVYGGMREGLADFGAVFAQFELGQVAGARAGLGLALRAFHADYLERDLEYWRIPNYGPSAGLLLHFVATYGKDKGGYQWQRYRKFFRDYRGCKVDDARTPDIARAFAFHLVEAFGEQAFGDLIGFRWPLLEQDLEAVRREQQAAAQRPLAARLDDQPGSPVPRDQAARRLSAGHPEPEDYREHLGVVLDWQVIGPFRRNGVDPTDYRFPPEHEVDLDARYESVNHNPTWRRPGPKPVTVDDTGWVHFDFPYMDDTAFYALTHVTVAADTDAWLHVRADDDLVLFVDDALVGEHDFARGPLGPWRPGSRTLLPDAIRFPVTLHAGRNKILLKVRNRRGPSGFALAVADRRGTPIEAWTTDVAPPERKASGVDLPDTRRWSSVFRQRFDSGGSARKLDVTVGKWRVRNGALAGTETDREVEWRKYTVRPGFPKDSPSNLMWLPERATQKLDALHLLVELEPGQGPPKLCVILQGDGMRDALSGWTLVLEPVGREQVRAHLERYDRRIYMSDAVPWRTEARDKQSPRLELLYWADRLTVRIGDAVPFDQAPLRAIPGRTRIGFATWGESPRIESIELKAPPRTR